MYKTITKLAHTLFGTQTTRKTQPVGSRFRPRLECLEERAVPATINVVNGNDDGAGSLRAAIIEANKTTERDTINIPANLTINLQSALDPIKYDLTILGIQDGNSVVQRSAGALVGDFRIFMIEPSRNVLIKDLVIANGKVTGVGESGGGIYSRGVLTLNNVTLSNNRATQGGGGGIFSDVGATLTVQSSTIVGNSASDGGGIAATGGTATILNSLIMENTAQNFGGGIAVYRSTQVNVFDTMIDYNFAKDGGGVHNGGGVFNMTNGRIYFNDASRNGGGLHCTGNAALGITSQTMLDGVLIRKNHAIEKGGGIYLKNGDINFNSCNIIANTRTVGINDVPDSIYYVMGATFTQTNTSFDVPPIQGA